MDHFVVAARSAAAGDVAACLCQLEEVRNGDLQTWYIEHGQVSGYRRNGILRRAKPQPGPLDPEASPERLANSVFLRDGYRCRYCGLRVVHKKVLEAFSNVVGKDIFRATGTNEERHGVVLAFRANADHVMPHSLGGKTDMHNLVTACWCCNYGKGEFTLNQMRLEDPRERQPLPDSGWDGLTSLEPTLRAVAVS